MNTLDDVLTWFDTLHISASDVYPFNTDISTAILRKLKDKMKISMYPGRKTEEPEEFGGEPFN